MIQLLINGVEALLPKKFSFKLLRCNSYFDEQKGDYTFEVQLPLKGSAKNLSIFGALHRSETELKSIVERKYPMVLNAPPVSLSGYAQIKSVTDESLKVQLVAGRSAIQHGLKDDETYIDELELGRAWAEFPSFQARGDYEGGEVFVPGNSLHEMKRIFYYMPRPTDNPDIVHKMAWGTSDETDCVAFRTVTPPINNWETGGTLEHYDTTVNPWYYEVIRHNVGTEYFRRLDVQHDLKNIYWERTQIAPQPYLFAVIKKIIKAIGYVPGEMKPYLNTRNWMRNILIANTNPDIRIAKCLPHWTVGKFLTEVERFLGGVWVINGKNIDLWPVSQYYTQPNVVPLSDVLASFSTEIDKESDYAGTGMANIDYNWPSMDDRLKLPDEVFENSEQLSFQTEGDMNQYYADLGTTTQRQSHQLYGVNKSYYASLHDAEGNFSLVKVDQAGALVNSDTHRDADIELDMVPCMVNEDGYMKATRYYRPKLYSIDSAINRTDQLTEDEENEERDVMELACNDHDNVVALTEGPNEHLIPTGVGFPYLANPDGSFGIPATLHLSNPTVPDGHFSLKPGNLKTAGDNLSMNLKRIDSRVEKIFEFIDNVPLDPVCPYLINNRIYACHKLDVTVDENGIQPIKRGYFFELDERA